jgi:hypothetical protein
MPLNGDFYHHIRDGLRRSAEAIVPLMLDA